MDGKHILELGPRRGWRREVIGPRCTVCLCATGPREEDTAVTRAWQLGSRWEKNREL